MPHRCPGLAGPLQLQERYVVAERPRVRGVSRLTLDEPRQHLYEARPEGEGGPMARPGPREKPGPDVEAGLDRAAPSPLLPQPRSEPALHDPRTTSHGEACCGFVREGRVPPNHLVPDQ